MTFLTLAFLSASVYELKFFSADNFPHLLQDRMEVIIMVSGWMEEDEDDKRTFGVIPSDEKIGLKVICS